MIEILATFKNEDDGMTSFVTKGEKGFHVSLKDEDSGMFVPIVTIYNTQELAVAKAKELV